MTSMVDVSVIGCGNMGGALVHGLAAGGRAKLTVYDVDPSAFERIEGVDAWTTTDVSEASGGDYVFLAVKPELVSGVLGDLALAHDQTVVSIAAGVPTETIAKHTNASVARLMPNLAARWGEMAAAITGEGVDEDLMGLLADLGTVVQVDEGLMDTATALNGSGPAFVYYVIDAMATAAVEQGMERAEARLLAAQTVAGAAETVLRSDEPIPEMIEAVCSPKGTTIEGMNVLRASDLETTIAEAIEAAERRGQELAAEVADG